jgi:Terminase large subunit, T4likevirus-type, N-terminal
VIASDLAAGLDPVVFSRLAGIDPDEWQRTLLRSEAPRTLLNCSRQVGKSTATGVLAVWTAIYQPGSLVLMLSPSLRQSTELFRKAIDAYRAAGRPVPATSETLLRLELANGSRIVSLPGDESTVRGFSAPALVLVDEAARVEDDLIVSVTPMLATSTNARLIALSSPAGKRGWWYDAWTDGGASWERQMVKATDVPHRISAAFLESERALMPATRFRQEFLCSFEEADAAVFAADAVSEAIDPERRPLRLEVFDEWTG